MSLNQFDQLSAFRSMTRRALKLLGLALLPVALNASAIPLTIQSSFFGKPHNQTQFGFDITDGQACAPAGTNCDTDGAVNNSITFATTVTDPNGGGIYSVSGRVFVPAGKTALTLTDLTIQELLGGVVDTITYQYTFPAPGPAVNAGQVTTDGNVVFGRNNGTVTLAGSVRFNNATVAQYAGLAINGNNGQTVAINPANASSRGFARVAVNRPFTLGGTLTFNMAQPDKVVLPASETVSAFAAPEPNTWTLLVAGVVAAMTLARRRHSRRAPRTCKPGG